MKNQKNGLSNKQQQTWHTIQWIGWLCILALGLSLTNPLPARAIELTVCSSGCSYTTIQAAINAITPGTSGHIIKVAQGTYNEKLSTSEKGFSLIGGFAPPNFTTPSTDPTLTIINANGKNDSAIYVGSGITGLTVTIENFTVKNGTGRFDGSSTNGGGIRIQRITATIRNNIIENNTADAGGGIQLTDNNTPLPHLITNNIIRNNTASNARGIGFGGGLDMNTSAATVVGNTFSGNVARCGAGMVVYASNATVERNTFSGNNASLATAGQGCVGSDGGALFIELVNTSPSIKNNLIINNTALRGDGINIAIGPGQPQIVNNTIVNNKNSDGGFDDGIFYVGENITPIIRNNIIALNGSGIHRGNNVATPYPVISNNLVWGNNQTNYRNLSAGSGDISADPLFVNLAGGDYHVQAGSPAIDTGTSANAPNNDLAGQSRPMDGNGDGSAAWDMGAYEFVAWLIKTVSPTAVEPGDTVQFTLKYQNSSSTTATSVTLTDLLSTNFDTISYTSSGATVTPQGGSPYTWNMQNLSTGQGGIITITARVKPGTTTPLAITNQAQFVTANVGSYNSQASIIVGGLKTYLPIILK